MRKIDSLLTEYGESHQTKLNKIIHYFCVPSIFFSLIGLLACIPVGNEIKSLFPVFVAPYIHIGSLIIFLGLFYYLTFSIPLFIGMFIFSTLVLLGIHQIEIMNLAPLWSIMLFIFVIGWIVQFIGHKHEGKKPSFFKDIQFLMIGPAWTMSHVFELMGIKY
ncbi:Mpo1 family 2-hydroxy fatty acid dioxygenase [Aquimarina agarilytica]|uniref:Mpo1 family 2-hydroxy fatty acid dioxygenase n=1 Tax=Aquimarina agarilytica TaxID=1087449 RepID=UPI000492994F|nr:Mpo1-like protein [Aquimarina agarilytica]